MKTFGEWLQEAYPEGSGNAMGAFYDDDMRAAFEAGCDAATDHYARGGSFK